MTKNNSIYLVRNSKQLEWASFQRALSPAYGPSVINRFIFVHGVVVIHFIMQRKPTNFTKKKTSDVRRFSFRHFVYLVNSSAITPQNDYSLFATIAVHFIDKLFFSCPLFHLSNDALQWWRLTSQNVNKFDVTGALLFVA